MRNIFTRFILLLLPLTLNGCVDTVASGVVKTGLAVAQERSVGAAVDDVTIWTEIKHFFLQENLDEILAAVHVEVIEGRVHLTGNVKEPEYRVNAVRLAWLPNGTKEVINEINVTENRSVSQVAKDKWLKAQISSKLLMNEDIRSINYSIDIIDNTVYLMGIAQDENELNLVTSVASTVKGVTRVISHVRLKDDPSRSRV